MRYDDSDVFRALRRHATDDGRISRGRYDQRTEEGEPTSVRILQRFGSWNAAVEAAGLEATVAKGGMSHVWTDADCIDALVTAANGERLTYDRYHRIAIGDPTVPSPQTVRNRFGTWNRALEAAGLAVGTHR